MSSPGERIGRIIQSGLDQHFNEEIESYCKRHNTKPNELSVDISPKGDNNNKLVLSLGPSDHRLIIPKRVWELTIKLEET
jgi:hypothetical protein